MTTTTTNNVPRPAQEHVDRAYGTSTKTPADPPAITTELSGSAPIHPHLNHSATNNSRGRFNEEWDASQRGSSIIDSMNRSNSVMSQGETIMPSRGGTLKKKNSVKRSGSLKRGGSRRSSRAGSVRSLALHPGAMEDEENSAFNTPVPLTGNPTEVLANRFQRRCLVQSFVISNLLTDSRMAEDSKGPHNLFPRNPKPVRASSEVLGQDLKLDQQH